MRRVVDRVKIERFEDIEDFERRGVDGLAQRTSLNYSRDKSGRDARHRKVKM